MPEWRQMAEWHGEDTDRGGWNGLGLQANIHGNSLNTNTEQEITIRNSQSRDTREI